MWSEGLGNLDVDYIQALIEELGSYLRIINTPMISLSGSEVGCVLCFILKSKAFLRGHIVDVV
jgi:hypothetical protein